jgi:hypothetical protein
MQMQNGNLYENRSAQKSKTGVREIVFADA